MEDGLAVDPVVDILFFCDLVFVSSLELIPTLRSSNVTLRRAAGAVPGLVCGFTLELPLILDGVAVEGL